MKRWDICAHGVHMRLYYESYEKAFGQNPSATSIVECFDYSYLEYINKIQEKADFVGYDSKGRKVFKVARNAGVVFVRLYRKMVDGKEFFFDSCDFQRHDEASLSEPILWTWTTPEEFCKLFMLKDEHVVLPVEAISLNQLKKLNGVRFFNRKGKALFVDCHGYFYMAEKSDLPTRRGREEYERLKGNTQAVYVKMKPYRSKQRNEWFESDAAAEEAFRQFVAEDGNGWSLAEYKVLRRGYKLPAPEDRRVIFRFPYFELKSEIDYEIRNSQGAHNLSKKLAIKWSALLDKYEMFGGTGNLLETLEDLVTAWMEFEEARQKKTDIKTGSGLETNPKRTKKEVTGDGECRQCHC